MSNKIENFMALAILVLITMAKMARATTRTNRLMNTRRWLGRAGFRSALVLAVLMTLIITVPIAMAAKIGTYDQCSNDLGTGYTSGSDLGCRWINGNLNSNNAIYFEGDATVQRFWLDGLEPGTTHTVTFQYGTTKAGKHAYDFLTSWDSSENWITLDDRCQDITGCTTASEDILAIPHDPGYSGTFETGIRNFVMRGGTLDSATTPTLVSGTYTGDSEIDITITYTVDSSGDMCSTKGGTTTCGVTIWFGAHISKSSEWEDEDGTTGATSIPGSPYHVALDKLDGASVGQRDNQMQTGAIPLSSTITLVKTVVNDNGGTAVATDWILNATNATGPTSISGVSGNSAVTDAVVDPGTYELSESDGPSGYTASLYSCVINDGDPVPGNSVILEDGDTAVCTITNDDDAPTLVLEKILLNNHGGTAVTTDFTLTAEGPTSISGAGGADSNSVVKFEAGDYTLSELSVPGYESTNDWSCTGEGFQDGDLITLDLGDSAICSITNIDIAPHLTLIKTVINDSGGTAVATDWMLNATGPTSIGGAGGVDSDVSAGTYELSEAGPAGYTASAWNCDGGIQDGNNITLGLDESATCTITNDDDAPSLTLVKEVINNSGGTAIPSDWTLTAAGYDELSPDAGTYDLSEDGPAGYTQTSLTCSNTGDTQVTSATLGLGEDVTCTFVNDDDAAHLVVIKEVTNDNTGVKTASEFTMVINGVTAEGGNTFQGAESPGVEKTLTSVGSYSVTEVADPAYITSYSPECEGTIALAETKTCTVTNNDVMKTARTQGFWSTHLTSATSYWNDTYSIGSKTVNDFQMEGGFWADIAKETDHKKRNQLDQARMRLLQQLEAAILNMEAFGPYGTTDGGLIDAGEAAFIGNDVDAINSAASALDAWNNAGDAAPFPPGFVQGSANPKGAKAIAEIGYWDTTYP